VNNKKDDDATMTLAIDDSVTQNGHAADDLVPPGIPFGSDPRPASIDELAEWGVGDKDLDFDEIRAGVIDHLVQQWFERLKSPRDALEFLLHEGIVTADQARTDV
jgi:hypothetical protein